MKFIYPHYTRHQVKIRFIAVGIWNTLLGYLLYYLLDSLFLHVFRARYLAYMSALSLAQIVSIIIAYFSHKHLTFKSITTGKETVTEFARFSLTYAFVFLLNMILLPLTVELGNISPKIAGAMLTILTPIISYIGHSTFSFRNGKNKE